MPRKAEAILARHVDVHERDVDRVLGGQRLRDAGVFCAKDHVAVGAEVLLQHFADIRLVVDNQDGGFWAHGRRLTPARRLGGRITDPVGGGIANRTTIAR
jgi:hypothetical protein